MVTGSMKKMEPILHARLHRGVAGTAHLLSSPANAARLDAAHEEIEKEIARRARRRRR